MSRLGGEFLHLQGWMSMHLVFDAFSFRPLLDIHELATTFLQLLLIVLVILINNAK